ncbi:21992_t:CDS:1, partial [Racocetra persica]
AVYTVTTVISANMTLKTGFVSYMKSLNKPDNEHVNLWISSLKSICEDERLPQYYRRKAKGLLSD